LDPHLRLRTSPIARPDAVVQGDRFRITVLTAGLLRIEWSDDGIFEDRASTFALHRDLPVPDFEVVDGEGALEIVTDRVRLVYDRGPFTPAGLSAQEARSRSSRTACASCTTAGRSRPPA